MYLFPIFRYLGCYSSSLLSMKLTNLMAQNFFLSFGYVVDVAVLL